VGEKYELVVGKSSRVLDREGNITLKGVNITIEGNSTIKHKAPRIDSN
jgi:hypothetical protein